MPRRSLFFSDFVFGSARAGFTTARATAIITPSTFQRPPAAGNGIAPICASVYDQDAVVRSEQRTFDQAGSRSAYSSPHSNGGVRL